MIFRNKDLKSAAKSNSSIQQSNDLDLFNFLNTTKSVNSDEITNPLGRDAVRRDSLLSTSDKIEEDQSSGYETSLSTKHSGTPVKTSKEESSTVTTVHELEVLSEDSCKQSRNTHSSITSDLQLENKLLRSEVSSLSQEVSGLLRRNHKASEEIKQLTGQVSEYCSLNYFHEWG